MIFWKSLFWRWTVVLLCRQTLEEMLKIQNTISSFLFLFIVYFYAFCLSVLKQDPTVLRSGLGYMISCLSGTCHHAQGQLYIGVHRNNRNKVSYVPQTNDRKAEEEVLFRHCSYMVRIWFFIFLNNNNNNEIFKETDFYFPLWVRVTGCRIWCLTNVSCLHIAAEAEQAPEAVVGWSRGQARRCRRGYSWTPLDLGCSLCSSSGQAGQEEPGRGSGRKGLVFHWCGQQACPEGVSGFRGTFEEGRLKMDVGHPSRLRADTKATLCIEAQHLNVLARQPLHKHSLAIVLPALLCHFSVSVFIISLLSSSMYLPISSLICLSVSCLYK